MHWTYDQGDPALMLWTAAVERFQIHGQVGARILELGCAETDWLERMHQQNPSLVLTGVDARPQDRGATGFTLRVGDARDPELFAPESFDAVCMLGALEHFGLGFYGDPVDKRDEHGDIQTMQNVVRWLVPGGLVYFDVPCNPEYSITQNRHFRIYSPASITERLIVPGLQERARGYSLPEPEAGTWCMEPTEMRTPYHYCAVVAMKA